MADIFSTESSVFFVGGTGTKAGNANCGGCTKDWFDNNFTQLSDIMGDNGAPIISASGCSFTNSTKYVTCPGPAFSSAQVGMVAYVSGTNISPGFYKITQIVTDYTVQLSGINATGNNTDTTINIGGAFDSFQNAVDGTSAAYYDCNIYVNKNATLTDTVDVDTGGGSVVANTNKRIIGFHSHPADMRKGGQYYQSAFDALRNGVDTNKCVQLDGDDGAYDVLYINVDNIILENFYLHNTNEAAGNSAASLGTGAQFITIRNCKFDAARQAVENAITGLVLVECFCGSNISGSPLGAGDDTTIVNSVLQTASTTASLMNHSTGSVLLFNSILIGGGKGLNNNSPDTIAVAINCIFYNQTLYCLWLRGVSSGLLGFNNIFMPQAGANGVYIDGSGASVLYNDYNCYIDTTGNELSEPVKTDYTNGTQPAFGEHSLEVDPEFVDAANGDFRPRNTKVLRGGRPDLAGNIVHMGAIIQKNQLAIRSRIANLGRLGIFR
jgi:hypothetical protein